MPESLSFSAREGGCNEVWGMKSIQVLVGKNLNTINKATDNLVDRITFFDNKFVDIYINVYCVRTLQIHLKEIWVPVINRLTGESKLRRKYPTGIIKVAVGEDVTAREHGERGRE